MDISQHAATWANADLLHSLTGYRPETDVRTGVQAFVIGTATTIR